MRLVAVVSTFELVYGPVFAKLSRGRKCKENAENHHASKKQMEVIVFPTQRQPLATFIPNTLTQIQTKETCSTTVSFKCIKPVWHKSGCSRRVSPTKRPRQSEDICGTKKSKKRLHRL